MQGTTCAAAMHASGNLLLDALADARYRRLERHLELLPLPFGRILSESNARLGHVYFPRTGIVSILTALADETSEEVAVTGNEALIGISAFLEQGKHSAPPRRAVVQHAGHAWRLPAALVAEEFERDGEFRRVLLRYTQALVTQIAQTAVCNRHHRIAQQLPRWLLLRVDRWPGHELPVTQKQIANLLGVRREAVTAAVGDLRRAELVRFKRGRVTVLDRAGLEQKVCECYTVITKEYARLLPHARTSPLSQEQSTCVSVRGHATSRSDDRRVRAYTSR